MKKILILLSMLTVLVLVGCGRPPIMAPIRCQKPIEFQINKSARLKWQYGKQKDAAIQSYRSYSAEPGIEELALAIADHVNRENNPSQYTVSYGKAEQAIFMTSFRDTLVQHQAFKDVELVNEPVKKPGNDVLIDVDFKTARVSSAERLHRITLTVLMTITAPGKPPFQRTYLVQNNKESGLFIDQQHNVSEILLDKLIDGIGEWNNLNNKGKKA